MDESLLPPEVPPVEEEAHEPVEEAKKGKGKGGKKDKGSKSKLSKKGSKSSTRSSSSSLKGKKGKKSASSSGSLKGRKDKKSGSSSGSLKGKKGKKGKKGGKSTSEIEVGDDSGPKVPPTLVVGTGCLDLLPIFLGQQQIVQSVPIYQQTRYKGEEVISDGEIPRLLVEITTPEPILPPESIEGSNILHLTMESVYNLPSILKPELRYQAAVLLPNETGLEAEAQPLGQFLTEFKEQKHKKWATLTKRKEELSDDPNLYTQYKINSSLLDIKNSLHDVQLDKILGANVPHIEWNFMKRRFISAEGNELLKKQLEEHSLWPVELYFNIIELVEGPTGGKKKKGKEGKGSKKGSKKGSDKSSKESLKKGGKKKGSKSSLKSKKKGSKSSIKSNKKGSKSSIKSKRSSHRSLSSKSTLSVEEVAKEVSGDYFHLMALADLSNLMYPGVSKTRVVCQLRTFQEFEARDEAGLAQSYFVPPKEPAAESTQNVDSKGELKKGKKGRRSKRSLKGSITSLSGEKRKSKHSKGSLKGSKGSLKGSKKSLKGSKKSLKGSKNSLKGSKKSLKGSKKSLKGSKGSLKGKKGSAHKGKKSKKNVNEEEKDADAVPEEPPPPDPSKLVYNDRGEPVFIILEVELLKPLVPKKELSELSEELSKFVPFKAPLAERLVKSMAAERNYQAVLKSITENMCEQYNKFTERCLRNVNKQGGDAIGVNDFVAFIVQQGDYQRYLGALVTAVTDLVNHKFVTNEYTMNGEKDRQNYMAHIYEYLVKEMNGVVNKSEPCGNSVQPKKKCESKVLYAKEMLENCVPLLARKYYVERIVDDNRNPDRWIDYATCLLQQQNTMEAFECVKEALSIDPDDKYSLLMFGLMQAELGQWEESEVCFQKLHCLYPHWAEGYVCHYLVYKMRGHKQGCDYCLEKFNVCREYPTPVCDQPEEDLSWSASICPDTAFGKAIVLLLKLKMILFGKRALEEDLQINGNSGGLWYYYKAVVLYLDQQFFYALDNLMWAEELMGYNTSLYTLIGHCLMRVGKYKAAKRYYKIVIESDKKTEDKHMVYVNQALLHDKHNELTEAKNLLLHVCQRSPTPYTWFNLGRVYLRDQDLQKAEICFSESNKLDNRLQEAWAHLSLIALERTQTNEAQFCARETTRCELKNNVLVHTLEDSVEELRKIKHIYQYTTTF